MKLAIITIQRDRSRWLNEWFAFHNAMGFDKFYFFIHKCSDDTEEKIIKLKKYYEIDAFIVPDDIQTPQLSAYQWAYQNFNHEFDWCAFLDGDEFLFNSENMNIKNIIFEYDYMNLSALGIYWRCFGSSGHIEEPDGFIIQNYTYRATDDFLPNAHIKSIVRGRQGKHMSITNNAHFFSTISGTYDTDLRLITGGFTGNVPTYKKLLIHHYVVQSYNYYLSFKKHSGAADSSPQYIRQLEWWNSHDRNEIYDPTLVSVGDRLKKMIPII